MILKSNVIDNVHEKIKFQVGKIIGYEILSHLIWESEIRNTRINDGNVVWNIDDSIGKKVKWDIRKK